MSQNFTPGVLPLGHSDASGQFGPSSPQAHLVPSSESSILSLQEPVDFSWQSWLELIGFNSEGRSVCDIINTLGDLDNDNSLWTGGLQCC